ncbi:MAG TPA: hypothetical protein VE594_06545, partial [Nitrososphaeraceae archaeon]|nr:hypothetical protein [Nitrososphaeraceae archaeon]
MGYSRGSKYGHGRGRSYGGGASRGFNRGSPTPKPVEAGKEYDVDITTEFHLNLPSAIMDK